MDPDQRLALEELYAVKEWHGRHAAGGRAIAGFSFDGSELSGWTLYRTQRDEDADPTRLHTLWHRGDPMRELLSIDVWTCPSVAAAHDQVLEVLANMQTTEIVRHRGADALGDVHFGHGVTMALFARANAVVLIRNGGPDVVDIRPFAHAIDALLAR